MPDMDGLTAEELRARANHLRDVLRVLDVGGVEASGRERAFIAGALRAVELMKANLEHAGSVEPGLRKGRA